MLFQNDVTQITLLESDGRPTQDRKMRGSKRRCLIIQDEKGKVSKRAVRHTSCNSCKA